MRKGVKEEVERGWEGKGAAKDRKKVEKGEKWRKRERERKREGEERERESKGRGRV